jgi:putative lipoic acid-binding regulatory protein
MSAGQQPEGMTFPCEFMVKAMGLHEPGFDTLVVEIIERHGPQVRDGAVSHRPSANGKYVSVSVSFKADSREQLDAIYDALTAHDKVLMRL